MSQNIEGKEKNGILIDTKLVILESAFHRYWDKIIAAEIRIPRHQHKIIQGSSNQVLK